jgi:hypothetical protein
VVAPPSTRRRAPLSEHCRQRADRAAATAAPPCRGSVTPHAQPRRRRGAGEVAADASTFGTGRTTSRAGLSSRSPCRPPAAIGCPRSRLDMRPWQPTRG